MLSKIKWILIITVLTLVAIVWQESGFSIWPMIIFVLILAFLVSQIIKNYITINSHPEDSHDRDKGITTGVQCNYNEVINYFKVSIFDYNVRNENETDDYNRGHQDGYIMAMKDVIRYFEKQNVQQ